MKRLAAAILLAFTVSTVSADIPADDRQGNWGPSCGHASMCIVLQEHGLPETARKWRASYGGPSTISGLSSLAVKAGLEFYSVQDGDSDFLDFCSETRLKAGMWWRSRSGVMHSVVFYGFSGDKAWMVDPNTPSIMRSASRAEFVAWWKRSGGNAFTAVHPDQFATAGLGLFERWKQRRKQCLPNRSNPQPPATPPDVRDDDPEPPGDLCLPDGTCKAELAVLRQEVAELRLKVAECRVTTNQTVDVNALTEAVRQRIQGSIIVRIEPINP